MSTFPPLFKLNRYVLPQRVWLLSHFGVKQGNVTAHLLAVNFSSPASPSLGDNRSRIQ